MKFKSGIEQTLCILTMLALQKNSKPVRSSLISGRLAVSDSYLKKIMRQLVVFGLVTSDSGREGGFRLARPLLKITLLDVFDVIEGKAQFAQSSGLSCQVFSDHVQDLNRKDALMNAFGEAEQLYRKRLKQFNLGQLLTIDHQVDWESIIKVGREHLNVTT